MPVDMIPRAVSSGARLRDTTPRPDGAAKARGVVIRVASSRLIFRNVLSRGRTARQAYLAGLIYTPFAVDREGRVKVDNRTCGRPRTQEALLPYHGTGKRILLGRDPDDLSQPALAFDEAGDLIAEGIATV